MFLVHLTVFKSDYSIMFSTTIASYLDTLAKVDIDIRKPANLESDYFRDSVHQHFVNKLISNLKKRFDAVIVTFKILTLKNSN